MEILKFDISSPNKDIVKKAAAILEKGGVIIFPTDTVYGIAADATNTEAIKKIFKLKKRDTGKPVSVVVKDIKTARFYAYVSKKVEKILGKLLPGPFTVILRKKEKLPDILTAFTGTIGFRIPKFGFTDLLSKEFGRPYTATSANISGKQATCKMSKILETFSNGEILPDAIIDAGDLPVSDASVVVDLTAESPKILRTGPVSKERLFEIIKTLE